MLLLWAKKKKKFWLVTLHVNDVEVSLFCGLNQSESQLMTITADI